MRLPVDCQYIILEDNNVTLQRKKKGSKSLKLTHIWLVNVLHFYKKNCIFPQIFFKQMSIEIFFIELFYTSTKRLYMFILASQLQFKSATYFLFIHFYLFIYLFIHWVFCTRRNWWSSLNSEWQQVCSPADFCRLGSFNSEFHFSQTFFQVLSDCPKVSHCNWYHFHVPWLNLLSEKVFIQFTFLSLYHLLV